MEPIVYAILIAVMLVIAVVLLQNPERVVSERLLERHAHTFNPATNANVKRIVTVIAPPQTINSEKFAVEVDALPLAADAHSGAGVKRVIAECLAAFAGVAQAEGQPKRATRLLGAVEALLEQIVARLEAADRAKFDRTLAAARATR